ncbi:hypothetical protein ACFQ5M_05210 [Agrilactobacillus yilanensis]|uniref:Uncharacterized protein n=1 Tax=Agrilactobacillus yilanensis TaxID=2485997 RepID=A0ABW4J532_9LACO|nr:hypothetical protein [Agrilactobacillus yilanensis]
MRHTRKRWVSLIIGPLSLLLVIGLFGVTTPVRADDQVTTAQNALQENQNQTTTLQAQIQAQEDKITEINNQIGNKTLALEKMKNKFKLVRQK